MVTMIRSDLDFILAQIKIAEADAQGIDIVAAGLVPNTELPWGLRRVDGSNNNLTPGQGNFGAADQPFPRTTTERYVNEGDDGMAFGPPILDPATNQPRIIPGVNGPGTNVPAGYIPGPGGNYLNANDYGVHAANTSTDPRAIQPGDVVDADPRIISNLVVDQTLNNPAAIAAALKEAGNPASTLLADLAAIRNAYEALQTAQASGGGAAAALAQATAALQIATNEFNAAQSALSSANNTVAAYAAAMALVGNAATAAQLAALEIAELEEQINTGALSGFVLQTDIDAANAAVAAAANSSALSANVLTALQGAPSPNGVSPADIAIVQALATEASQLLNAVSSFRDGLGPTPGAAVSAEQRDAVAALSNDADSLASALPSISTVLGASQSVAQGGATAAQTTLDTETAELAAAQSDFDIAAANAGAADVVAKTAALEALLEGYGISYQPHVSGDFSKATLFIGNVAPDEGLSAPFNGWMTFFGQFFDHGLDLVAKGGFGTVYVPLQPDDPLYVEGSPTNFMALTRATIGPDGQPVNLTTPFVDQNQTYTSNPSAQVFHREYEMRLDAALGYEVPVATGRLLNSPSGGLATWADVKAQALTMLGIELSDMDIHRIPELLVDPYGNFIPGANGFPQIVTGIDAAGQPVTAGATIDPSTGAILATVAASGALATGHAFLDDIAHNANPGAGEVADTDLTASTAADQQAAGTYDNELLDAHYITGDGRGNENIGLTAVHHVFHSEHNRQVDLIQNLLISETQAAKSALDALQGSADAAAIAQAQATLTDKLNFLNEWLDAPLGEAGIAGATTASVDWNGERIFQAARLPTEMQYQHLVFEEFARKVQPAVNAFNDFDGTLNPAILAEFAHTVYRFGHSMLTETVDRYDADWNALGTGGVPGEQIGLIEAFLNPLEFAASGINAEEAAGVIAQGMTRQRGNEIDEFVTEALRNNLVGLPLDLAVLNLARGREAGVPTLNEARTEFFAGSGDAQVKPYASWFEFMQNLKNPISVINFIAAYGTHSSIVDVTTTEEKRDAATLIVLGGAGAPADRLDFLHSAGAWAGNAELGGLNNVDFWIGGLAEKKLLFGGFLGSSFNFVFETQMESLQNGDRFYYLSRLANLNLTAQLENNKFSTMIHLNTTATHLPGDAFARPDFFLEADLSKQFNADLGVGIDPLGTAIDLDPFLGAAAGNTTGGAVLRTDVNGDGIAERLEYTGVEHVVLGGTAGNDGLIGGAGDDTLWGDGGDDRLEGGDGNDFIFGGEGNDTITDVFGIDEIRSGAGDDVVSAGRGIKLVITDTGNDWVWGGVDDDEVLSGQGDDFVNGGPGVDFIIGGEGNDWLETGTENSLILGDNGDLVQGLPIKRSVDSRIVGHDVLVSTGGNPDFDAETGDDIMVGGLGTDRFFGQFGFDWVTYKNDPFGIEADMNFRQFAPPSLPASPGAILDRYAQTEALAGSANGDILRGDDITDLTGGAGDAGAVVEGLDHALYDVNVGLINGLGTFLGSIDEAGDVRFSSGNILLGGASSDIIEGRGGNDLIDGDARLNVRIARVDATGTEVETHDTMAGYQERVLAGDIAVSELRIVREILDDNDNIDIAEYSGRRDDYTVEDLGDGFVTVTHLVRDAAGAIVVGEIGADGVDKLKNVDRLLFSDQTIKITDHANTIATGSPTVTSSTGTFDVGATLTASATGIDDVDGVGQITFYWQVETAVGSGVFTNIVSIVADEFAPVTGPSYTLTATEAGLAVRVLARFKDGDGVFETVVSPPNGGTGVPVDGVPLIGTAGDDVLIGTPAADSILGLGGNDTIAGLAGDDILDGGADSDTAVFFGQLADFLFERTPEGDIQIINQTTGEEDVILNVEFVRIVNGGVVNGQIVGTQLAQFTIAEVAAFADGLALPPNNVATNGDDVLVDVANNQFIIDGLGGNDEIIGLDLADQLAGGAGDDTLSGGAGNDQLTGGAGSDVIDGGANNDRAFFAGVLANFTLSISPAGNILVTEDATGDEDELSNVENFVFTDQTLTRAQAQTLAGLVSGTAGPDVFNGTAADEAFAGLGGADVLSGAGGDDVLLGGNGGDTLNGGAGRDGLTGGGGVDNVNGGADDDSIFWSVGDGRDTINGGAGNDTLEINGDAAVAETIRIFTADEAIAANLSAGASEIVITRTVGNAAATDQDRIALVTNVEEIVINGARLRDNSTAIGGDAIEVIGDFTTTSLALNTITVDGGDGNDTVDISALTSAHRIVFRSNGGNDTIVGTLRPQDVIMLPAGSILAEYTRSFDADTGISTLSNGQQQISFAGDVDPTLAVEGNGNANETQTATGASGSGSGNGTEGDGSESESESESEEETETESEDDGEDETTNPGTVPPTGTSSGTGTGAGTGTGSGSGSGTGTSSGTGTGTGTGTSSTNGTGNGTGNGVGTGTGTSTSAFVIYIGTAESETAFGSTANDMLAGNAGDDNLFGLDGADTMTGGDGDDYLDGGDGDDLIVANAGADTVSGGKGADTVLGGAGDDVIDAGDGDDIVFGHQGRDSISTGLGNDRIVATAGDGDDVIDAGEAPGDSDTLDMSALTGDATVFLSANGAGSAKSIDGGNDVIKGIENVSTGSGNDVIVASTDVNIMEGGLGNDTFVFNSATSANGDTISDFQDGDLVDLSPLFASLSLGEGVLTSDATFNAAGEFRLQVDGEDTLVQGNTDGDADVEFAIRILGRTDLEQNDFA